jgi:putative nucleotidyltransferase with HDIG domain
MNKTREQAYQLLCEWVKSESLRKHMLAVEAAMRAYAKKFGEDEETWGICGLLHDLDYEKFPQVDPVAQTGHPFESVKYFKEQDYPQDIIDAILGHATYSNTPRVTTMAKALYAVDELCGFVMACAYVRPTKLEGMEASSVKKKLKNKEFAAKISREDIEKGIAELGVDKDEHINTVICAKQGIAKELGF